MTTIKNTTTGEILDMACIVEGVDILADVLGGCGVESVALSEDDIEKQIKAGSTNTSESAFALEDDEVDWWQRWAEREERITEAYEEAGEEVRKAYEIAISEYGYDMEALQDEQERILGIE